MTTYSTDVDHVVSVWSAYGHTFIGEYLAANGDEPQRCHA